MKTNNPRREFIKSVAKGLAGTAIGSSLLPLLANAQSTNGYKALVCINLQGGNDAFNCFVPMSKSAYNSYAAIRQELAVPHEHLLTLNSKGQQAYGVNNLLGETQSLFNRGKLAIVSNVGNLHEPINKQAFFEKTALPPAHLFSHHDQTLYAHTLNQGELSSGWAGRVAELMAHNNINQHLAMNISLSGDNYLQRGVDTLPYTVRSSGVNMIEQLSETDPASFSASRAKLYRQFLSSERVHLLHRYYSQLQMDAWGTAQYVADILDSQILPALPLFATTHTSSFVQSLAMIVRLISARDAFEVKRQVFYVNLGGFDTHRDQLAQHAPLMMQLDQGLGLFYQALEALGLENNVTAFTMSEFGRTLTRNGDGTDHGWGSHHMVLGGAVDGQQIYGQLPTLEIDSDDDLGRGRIIPTTSFEQYSATLCRWFGIANQDLHQLLPNLRNFNLSDLGFLN
ncbi:DUF1501 domain-containing protein [Bowmanella yangjiangensis]|uniref:DUF1501 domain-containing protein n=1 Tax=Bowmanella yangjiangensis TaxID=2811230 RepID=A0ABS3CS91_9ALTE|nr:DUF1501 domain-containing protein [Bowmanella yangjiangensis]MBN7819977.1 DUF1501 domain-containing protein [Bowmanella yangjiangensis]